MRGEETSKELLRAIEENKELDSIKGITFRKGNKIVRNNEKELINDLNKIPFPSYGLLPMHKYRIGRLRYSAIITSRGCPFGCIFCSTSYMFGRKWRARSPENVVDELRLLRP